MKSGFTLLEVLIATAIASVLTVTLFLSFNQINNSVRKTAEVVDTFETALLVDRLLFHDFLGAFIPVQAVPEQKKKKPTSQEEAKKPTQQKTGEKEAKKTESKEQPEQEKEKKVPVIKDPFMGQNEGERMKVLTCITANPMRVYWGEKTGEPKPCCVRVVYTLEEQKAQRGKKEPRYTLYRQEGTELDLSLYTKKESSIERYLIADNIISCTARFMVVVEKEKEKEEKAENEQKTSSTANRNAAEEEKPEKEVKEFNDWIIKKDADEKDLRKKLLLPDQIIMDIELSDEANIKRRKYTFRLPIAAKFHEVPVQEQRPKAASGDKGASQEKGQDAESKEPSPERAKKMVQNFRAQLVGRA